MISKGALLACATLVFQVVHGQDVDVPLNSVVLSTPRTTVLYRGIENPLMVAIPGVPCDSLRVRFSAGRVEGRGCSYTIIPGVERRLTVHVEWTDNVGSVQVVQYEVRVKEIPLPEPYFAGNGADDDSLSTKAAKAAIGVIARVEGFDLKVPVTGYRLILERACELIFDGWSTEAKLSDDMRAALQACSPGDRLRIEEIRAKYPSGSQVDLDDLRFLLY